CIRRSAPYLNSPDSITDRLRFAIAGNHFASGYFALGQATRFAGWEATKTAKAARDATLIYYGSTIFNCSSISYMSIRSTRTRCLERRCRVQKSRATISRAAYPFCRRPARTRGGTGRSSTRSRSEHHNRYYEPSHDAPAHWARPAAGRTDRYSTEVR